MLSRVLLFFFLAGSALANLMPVNEPLLKAESGHFIYIYQPSLKDQLPRLIKDCEDAHTLLAPVFRWTPHGKTIVLFHDAWDEHNGSSTTYPRPTLAVLAAGALPGSAIYETGDGLRRTLFHEYAQARPMDAQYGTGAGLSSFFGRVQPSGDVLSSLLALCAAPPNALAPAWYLEGLSIWAETEFAGPGRGRNGIADMILRMPVADHRPLDPEQWDLRMPEWPFGQSAYLYGMMVMNYAQQTRGVQPPESNIPGELSDSVAHSFMYFFNGCAIPRAGVSFAQLTRDAMAWESGQQGRRIDLLKTLPLTAPERLTPPHLQVSEPKFGPDGRTVYFSASGEAERDTLYEFELDHSALRKLPARTETGLTRLTAPADRNSLLYNRLNYVGRDRLWSELMQYDLRHQTLRRVTRKGRYRFIAISPDGRTLAAVRNKASRYALIEVPLAQAGQLKDETLRVEAPDESQMVDPVYSADGRQILYVLAGKSGSKIQRLDRETGREETLCDWPCIIMNPAVHPSGKYLVFTSDRNGVYNLYKLPLDEPGKPLPITHVLGGLFAPDFSPDGGKLAVMSYDSYGYHLALFSTDQLPVITQPLPSLTPEWQSLSSNQRKVAQVVSAPAGSLPPSQPYRSWREIGLDYWTPWLASDLSSVQGGAAAMFADPVRYQQLFAMAGVESRFGLPVGSLTYRYTGFQPIFNLIGSYAPHRYADLVEDTHQVFYHYDETVASA
ncbi:MAG: hypothetical protein V2A34_05360, partial [Lentisphaerota bacterium]